MDRSKTKIPKTHIGNWRIPSESNIVIIEITEATKDKVTKSGIHIGFSDDVVYAEGDESHEADVAEVWGYVAGLPSKLYFNRKDVTSMPWDTEMELRIGDMVWFNYFASVNCDELVCGDRRFYAISYQDLYVAKRKDEIIPLNGYCLCEPVRIDYESDLAEGVVEHYEKNKVVVRHLGQPNKRYFTGGGRQTYHNDIIDVKEGDTVLLRKNYPLNKIERLDAISTFSDKTYYAIQRRFMEIVL
jgi:hypothetical protein